MKSYKVISIVGARPNFVKLKPIHNVLEKVLDHEILHTGQHYDFELSEIFFKEFNLPKPHFNLDVGSGLPGHQVGQMIKKIENVRYKKSIKRKEEKKIGKEKEEKK